MSEIKTTSTDGFIMACMNCHNGTCWDEFPTMEAAQKEAAIHLSIDSKMHGGHTLAIIPATLVKRVMP